MIQIKKYVLFYLCEYCEWLNIPKVVYEDFLMNDVLQISRPVETDSDQTKRK